MSLAVTVSLGDIIAIISLVGVGIAIGRWQTNLSRKIEVLSGKVTGVWTMTVHLIESLAEKGTIDAQEVSKLHVDYE